MEALLYAPYDSGRVAAGVRRQNREAATPLDEGGKVRCAMLQFEGDKIAFSVAEVQATCYLRWSRCNCVS